MRTIHSTMLLLGLLVACGGDDDGVGAADFPDAFLDATCENLVECGGMPDLDTCRESIFLDDGFFGTIQGVIDDGTVEFDADAAADCLDQTANKSCAFAGFYGVNACNHLFVGTLARGEACIIDFECSDLDLCTPTDTACDPDVSCCPGTCTAGVTLVAIGGTCDNNELVCDPEESFCAIPDTADTGTCTAPNATEGAACVEIDGCANPMYCDIFGASVCTAAPGTGEDCSNDELLPCGDNRDFCDDMTGKCITAIDVGGTCDDATGVFCVGFATCTAGTCVANPSNGDTCDEADDTCLGSLSCVGTTCAPPVASQVCN
ncbi:MAG: hypothetical protein ABI867_07450 [Kofleriaceae bacterium]